MGKKPSKTEFCLLPNKGMTTHDRSPSLSTTTTTAATASASASSPSLQSLPLCSYCRTETARSHNPYCCDACQTLAELTQEQEILGLAKIKPLENQDQTWKKNTLREENLLSEEDILIQKYYGEERGSEIQYTCSVEKLACEACVQQLSKLKNVWPEIQDLRWDRSSSSLSIQLASKTTSPSSLFQILSRMGLKPRWVTPEEAQKQTHTYQKSWLQIGLSGAIFGNIMLFAIPIYGGLIGDLARLFFWIQGILFLPVLLWAARPFYFTAWMSLKLKSLSTDLPLTLAFLTGSILSYIALWFDKPHWIYFDSLSGFIFLILLSRYLLERSLWKTESHHSLDRFFEKAYFRTETSSKLCNSNSNSNSNTNESSSSTNTTSATTATCATNSTTSATSTKTATATTTDTMASTAADTTTMATSVTVLKHLNELKKGDRLILDANQRVPGNSILLSSQGEFDTSWVSGEFWPQVLPQGSLVTGGSLTLHNNTSIELLQSPEDSDFIKLLSCLKSKGQKIHTGLESRIGTTLVTVSFLLALGLFLFFPENGVEENIKRSLALWIVACPCAVSFAAPLTRAKGSVLAGLLGFWVRDTLAFEKLHHIKKIAFDKTGTLTDSFLKISPDTQPVTLEYQHIILSLENISQHPIAKSLRHSFGCLPLHPVTQAREIIGLGVEGFINEDFYEFKRSQDPSRQTIELKKNGHFILSMSFNEALHPKLLSAFRHLLQSLEIFILSGDHPEKVHHVAKTLGVPLKNIQGFLSPEEKQTHIEKIQPDLYIGDGTNDLLALKKAPLSLSFGQASLEAQSASHIIMTHSDFTLLPQLFRLSQEIRSLLLRNLGIALVYNTSSAFLALTGFIGPLEAAVLMPIASALLLLSTEIKTRWLRSLSL
jgi:P-type E1-E2 ATPase